MNKEGDNMESKNPFSILGEGKLHITSLNGEAIELDCCTINAEVKVDDQRNTRERILNDAIRCVCSDRDDQYGSPEDCFYVISQFWSTYLNKDVSPKDVAAMMGLLKIARIQNGKAKADNWVDLAGYAACGAELEEIYNN